MDNGTFAANLEDTEDFFAGPVTQSKTVMSSFDQKPKVTKKKRKLNEIV